MFSISDIKPQVEIDCKDYFNSRFILSKRIKLDNEKMTTGIGKLIKDRLIELKKTQSWLAEVCGVSNNAVAKWIATGKVSRENLSKVSAALNIPSDKLLGKEVDIVSNEIERQLLFFFRNSKEHRQDDLIAFANMYYTESNPGDKKANPTNGKVKKEVKQ